MGFFQKFFPGLMLVIITSFSLSAQENIDKKHTTPDRSVPVSGINAGALKLKENMGYKIDPNTQIGLGGGGGGFKFGLKISF